MINNRHLAWKWAIIFMIWPWFDPFKRLGQKWKKKKKSYPFLVQMKVSKFAFEVKWPLALRQLEKLSFLKKYAAVGFTENPA